MPIGRKFMERMQVCVFRCSYLMMLGSQLKMTLRYADRFFVTENKMYYYYYYYYYYYELIEMYDKHLNIIDKVI